MSRSDAIAHRVRELYWESPSLQYLYAKSASTAAAIRARAGDDYAALEEYCNAIRRVRSPELRSKGIVRLNKFLSSRFAQSTPATLDDNVFVREFSNSGAGIAAKAKLKKLSPDRRVNLQGNLLVLKLPSANERGVLLVQYNYAIEQFLVNFKLAEVCSPKSAAAMRSSSSRVGARYLNPIGRSTALLTRRFFAKSFLRARATLCGLRALR